MRKIHNNYNKNNVLIKIVKIDSFREKPLALYVISNSKETIELFKTSTTSGGFCSNDVMAHCGGIILTIDL